MSSSGEVTALLSEIRRGNQQAEAELIPLVYDELRRIAAHYMRQERPGHTLQATALVNEAYLRLVKQREHNWENRAHFFGLAAGLMRRILVDHARSHKRSKRGGDLSPVPLDEAIVFSPQQSEELIELDEAMKRLAKEQPRQQKIVEMRFFGGLSIEEIAQALGISPKTVKRDWSVARAWLHREIRGGQAS